MQPVYYVVNHAIMLEFDGAARLRLILISKTLPRTLVPTIKSRRGRGRPKRKPRRTTERPARLRGFCMCGRGRGRGSGAVTEGKNKSLGSGSLFELRENVPFLKST